ncbi:hypothetical protein [Endozoicomonas sp. GU-1]|uniref:hypothetical protein n=1 Tax=Endozoicomonas sp. GU-1 TaxID=3009078 RepID=UPI0022B2EF85|nr:hypothetical protein [Endozoicomonas sp. GU-1]WBA84907.1 hypothetical protein O3276_16735 [Endozoicomonas sp. GU-1]
MEAIPKIVETEPPHLVQAASVLPIDRFIAFSRECHRTTANRVIIEVDGKVFNTRPDIFEGVKVVDYDSCQSNNTMRFEEQRGRSPVPYFPGNNKKAHAGISVEVSATLFPDQYDCLKKHYDFFSMKDEQASDFDLASQNEGLPKQLSGYCIAYLSEYSFRIRLKPLDYLLSEILECIGEDQLILNSPAIAKKLYLIQHGEDIDFHFIKFLSNANNNSVILVENTNGERYVIKHIWGRMTELKQNYPETFTVLTSVRQASLNKGLLSEAGSDISVTPVVSTYKFACVPVHGLIYDELAFFKMVPFVEGLTLHQAKTKNEFTSEEFNSIYKRIALYLARLHTSPHQTQVFRDSSGKCINVSVPHMHNHPHSANWLVNTDSHHLYLIDWDQYTDYVKTTTSPCLKIELQQLMKEIPPEYKETFKSSYIEEWGRRSMGIRSSDKKEFIELLGRVL